MAIILTDGKSNSASSTASAAVALRADNVNVYAIGTDLHSMTQVQSL